MTNVLIDMHRLKHNPYNGLYTFSKELGKQLSILQPADMNFHFYVPGKDEGIFGQEVIYEKHRSVDKFFRFGTDAYDVWHITTTLSWYRPFHKKVKVVYTIHDLNFLIEDKENHKRNRRVLQEISSRAERADYIVAISDYALAVANQYLPIAGKPQKVIYNGALMANDIKTVLPKYIPLNPFLFSIGQMYPRKNFHVLPPLLKGNEFELVIAGLHQTGYSAKVLEIAAEHGVQDRVHFVGPVSEEEKHWYYKECAAFLFPSVAEGFGLPVVEAMHYGKPVFLSTETCLPEVGGDAAYYFTTFEADEMKRQFEAGMRHYERDRPVAQIKARAAFFSWQKAAEQYIEIYRCLSSGLG